MKKYIDKIKSNIKINKSLFIFVILLVLIGIVTGSLFSVILNNEDKNLISNYLSSFLINIKTDNLINYFSHNLFFNVGFIFLLWLLGISVIGFILIIILLFIKSFTIGFIICSFFTNYKIKGILYAFIYIFPHQIINLGIFMLISSYCLIMAFKLINSVFYKKEINIKYFFNKYLYVLLVSLFIIILSTFYESYIMPKLFTFVI